MGLILDDDEDQSSPQPTMPAIPAVHEVEEYKSAVVETSRFPLKNLLAYAEGSKWTVDYYSQVLGKDDAPRVFSLETSPVMQQYHLIKSMELRVTSALEQTQDKENNAFNITGVSTVLPGTVIPNVGDVFLADFGDGREAFISVTEVETLSIMMDTGYTINYRVIALNDKSRVDNLNDKVIKTSVFRRELLSNGKNPVVIPSVSHTLDQINFHTQKLLVAWFSQFISKRHKLILVPEQQEPTYDFFLVKALTTFVGVWGNNALRGLTYPSLNEMLVYKTPSVWDVLLSGIQLDSNDIFKEVGVTGTSIVRNYPALMGIFYSPLKRLIYPKDNPYDVDDDHNVDTVPLIGDLQTLTESLSITSALSNSPLNADPEVDEETPDEEEPVLEETPELQEKEDIYPVTVDSYYVFSEAFYTGNVEDQSKLEYFTTQMLNNKAINLGDILSLLLKSKDWGHLERFYYIPVLVILVGYVKRRM